MKSLPFIIISLLLLTVYACGGIDTESVLRQAEDDLLAGKLELAASGCDILADTTSKQQLSSTQMCRIAIIYAKLSEASDNQDYMASATKCFERALSLDNQTDSIDRYIESLDVETQSTVRLIREVSRSMNTPYDYSQEDDEDSEMYTDETYEIDDNHPEKTAI